MRELERYDLTTSEWKFKTPLEKDSNDFVSDLCERYLEDVRQRRLKADWEGAAYCETIRKAVELNHLEPIVVKSMVDLLELTKSSEMIEAELAEKKRLVKEQKNVNFIIKNRLGFRKEEAFKRSISHTNKLEDFGDLEMHYQQNLDQKKHRKSALGHRGRQNVHVTDQVKGRHEQDFNKSETGSEASELFVKPPRKTVRKKREGVVRSLKKDKKEKKEKKERKEKSEVRKMPSRREEKSEVRKMPSRRAPSITTVGVTSVVHYNKEPSESSSSSSSSSEESVKVEPVKVEAIPPPMHKTCNSMVFAAISMDKADKTFRLKTPENSKPEDPQVMMMMSPEMVEFLGPAVKPVPEGFGKQSNTSRLNMK
jgi:hypothetical protein